MTTPAATTLEIGTSEELVSVKPFGLATDRAGLARIGGSSSRNAVNFSCP